MARPTHEAPSPQSGSQTRAQRLFFALWPDDNVRERLYKLMQQTLEMGKARQVSRDNLHATLVFLGACDSTTRQCLEQMASAVQAAPFTLTLDRLVYRSKTRILWVGASQLPESLRLLVDFLNSHLVACGLRAETREYHAHVTLARKVRKGRTIPINPIDWHVERFVLVESRTYPDGAAYQILRSWALGRENC